MTLAEAIKFMPGNQRLEIQVMGIELFSGCKGSLMHSVPKEGVVTNWINDKVMNMRSSNPDTIVIELKESVYTREIICDRILSTSPILTNYMKMYHYSKDSDILIKVIKLLLTKIRQNGDIL